VSLANNIAPGLIDITPNQYYPKGITGIISLTSTDPHVAPYFNFTPWSAPEDVTAVVEGMKAIRKIMKTYPANVTFGVETVPGPSVDDDDELAAYVRSNIPSIAHLWGGATLGNDGDSNAVLDWRARVKGVQHLRVCDLSIVPGFLGGGLPIANVVMFGERISDFIKQDNGIPL